MNKTLKVLLIIFLVILVLVAALAIYLYYFQVFKTIRFCLSQESDIIPIPCQTNQQCLDLLNSQTSIDKTLEQAPDFIKSSVHEITSSLVYCYKTCRMKKIRTNLEQELNSCLSQEKEFAIKIRGKEAIQILLFMKKSGMNLNNLGSILKK